MDADEQQEQRLRAEVSRDRTLDSQIHQQINTDLNQIEEAEEKKEKKREYVYELGMSL